MTSTGDLLGSSRLAASRVLQCVHLVHTCAVPMHRTCYSGHASCMACTQKPTAHHSTIEPLVLEAVYSLILLMMISSRGSCMQQNMFVIGTESRPAGPEGPQVQAPVYI